MGRKTFWIAASCSLVVAGLFPVFSFGATPASKEKVLYSFTGGADGGNPLGDLTIDGAGNLYGTTSQGGNLSACNGGCGTVFELKPTAQGWAEQVLYSFTGGADGGVPAGGLIFDTAGNLYGTTADGGDFNGYGYGEGTVFKLTPSPQGGWTESVLYAFTYWGGDGGIPDSDLAFDSQGNLYSTAQFGGVGACTQGCGAVIELTPLVDGSWTETTIHTFAGAPNDGGIPFGKVVLDSAGNVYGTTTYGGPGSCAIGDYVSGQSVGCGTVYKVTLGADGTWTETVLYNFARGGGFGVYVSGDLFFDNPGHLLGLTQGGGDGFGTLFELNHAQAVGWQQSEGHIFSGYPDGIRPIGRLVADDRGDLFGVTSNGGTGTPASGTAFELERLNNNWQERILYSFAGQPDGAVPSAGLVFDSQGNLYGTTQNGGSGTGCNQGCGTVYEVTP